MGKSIGTAIREQWQIYLAMAGIFALGLVVSSFIAIGKAIPHRLTALEGDTTTVHAVVEQVRSNTLRLNDIEPKTNFTTCVLLEQLHDRAGDGCLYFLPPAMQEKLRPQRQGGP